jgi:exonuclease VII large subunit
VQEQQKAVIGQIGQIGHMQSVVHRQAMARMEAAGMLLEQANPERQLRLGYSIVKNKQGNIIRSVRSVTKGDELSTQLEDGIINSVVN